MPDTAAVRPDEVPAAILDVAARTYASAYAGLAPEQLRETELNALRAAVAAALTLAREDIATRVEDPEKLADSARAAKYARWNAARMIREWPGGHRG